MGMGAAEHNISFGHSGLPAYTLTENMGALVKPHPVGGDKQKIMFPVGQRQGTGLQRVIY